MNTFIKKHIHQEPLQGDYLLYRYVYIPTQETVYVGMTIDLRIDGNSRDACHRCLSKDYAPMDKALNEEPDNYKFVAIGYFDKEHIETTEIYYIARFKTYYYWYKDERERAFNRHIGGPLRKKLSVKVVTQEFLDDMHKKSVEVKKSRGSYKSAGQKALETKKRKGILKSIAQKAAKTRREKGIDKIAAEKAKKTKEEKGINIIVGQKISAAKKGSQKAKEASAKAHQTKLAKNLYVVAAKKMLATRARNGTDKVIGPKMAATRRANNSFITGARKAAATKIANGQTKADAAKGIKTRQARPDYPEIVAKMVEAHKKNGTYELMASIRRQRTIIIFSSGEKIEFSSRNEAARFIGMAESYISSIITKKRQIGARLRKKLIEKGIVDIKSDT